MIVVSSDPAVQKHYELCRNQGTSHNLAVIFATGRAPGCVTDREVFRGHRTLGDQFDGEEQVFNQLVDIAEQGGRRPHYTDKYEPGLAAYPGDPEAFVPASGGREHIKNVIEKRNWHCDGLVKRTARNDLPPEPIPDPVPWVPPKSKTKDSP